MLYKVANITSSSSIINDKQKPEKDGIKGVALCFHAGYWNRHFVLVASCDPTRLENSPSSVEMATCSSGAYLSSVFCPPSFYTSFLCFVTLWARYQTEFEVGTTARLNELDDLNNLERLDAIACKNGEVIVRDFMCKLGGLDDVSGWKMGVVKLRFAKAFMSSTSGQSGEGTKQKVTWCHFRILSSTYLTRH